MARRPFPGKPAAIAKPPPLGQNAFARARAGHFSHRDPVGNER